jgi:hypothetical protein
VSDKSTGKNKNILFALRGGGGDCRIMSDHRKIDTRMPKALFELVDGYAAAQGIKRSAVIVQALEQFFGMQKRIVSPTEFAKDRKVLPANMFHAPEITLMQEEPAGHHGDSMHDPSAAPDGGSKTAQKSTAYPKSTRRRSSN